MLEDDEDSLDLDPDAIFMSIFLKYHRGTWWSKTVSKPLHMSLGNSTSAKASTFILK
jgi:hypothetical protein